MHGYLNNRVTESEAGEHPHLARVPILIYDGSCGFCTRAAMWISHHSANRTIALRTSQEIPADQLRVLGLTQDQAIASVWWTDGGSLLSGHAAISASLKNCQGGWRRLGRLLDTVPLRWIGPPIYRQIARHRHLLPGATSACGVDASRVGGIEKNVERS